MVVVLATPSVPADAHEIVARLERGSIDPSAVGLTRYAGTLRATSWTGPSGWLGVPIVADERVWFQAPKNLRLETTLATTSAPTTTVLMDDTQSWLWTPAAHSAFRLSATSTGTLAFLTGSEVQVALANVSRDYAAAGDGSETVAGRATDRVILTPLPGGAVSVEVGRVVLSVDHEHSIPLAGRVLDRNNQPVFEWAFNQIDFAPSFDSSIFVFAPEPGTIIVDLPSTGAVGAEAKWRELARGTTFTLFRPTFRSNTLEPGYPSRDQDRVVVSYRSATDLAAILIIEMAATNAFEPGEGVSLPTGAAVYRRDADRQRLIVRREGTRIELQAPLGGNRDDLMNAAASLVAVR